MFGPRAGVGGTIDGLEDTRLYGYDPMIPPALIQEEIPAVCLPASILLRQLYFSVSKELTL
jgi:hypothetical protein